MTFIYVDMVNNLCRSSTAHLNKALAQNQI